LKKQDKNPVDQFFKENIQQDFPYDSALWNKAEKGIATYFLKKRIIFFSAILLFISSIGVFFLYENTETTAHSTKIKNQSNLLVINEKESNSTITNTNANTNNNTNTNQNDNTKDLKDAIMQKQSVKAHDKDNLSSIRTNQGKAARNPKSNSTVKRKFKSSTSKNSGEKLENENFKKEGIIVSNDDSKKSPSAPIIPDVESKEINETQFTLLSKPLKTFYFENSNNKPETQKKNFDRKKKRFATTIEFEQLISTQLTQKLSGLLDPILAYRNQYETAKNSNGYALNVMLQRHGFGVIIGFGQQSATIKTKYLVNEYTYEFVTKYQMIEEEVYRPSGSKTLSYIREYDDTTSKILQQKVLENQSSQNEFNWLSIPLKLSYQYPIGRLRFSVRAGADFKWLYNTSGYLINNTLNGLVSVGEGIHSTNKFNINASGQIMAGYQINHRIQAGGSLYLAKQLGSDFSQYSSKFQSRGFGWYVRFNL